MSLSNGLLEKTHIRANTGIDTASMAIMTQNIGSDGPFEGAISTECKQIVQLKFVEGAGVVVLFDIFQYQTKI